MDLSDYTEAELYDIFPKDQADAEIARRQGAALSAVGPTDTAEELFNIYQEQNPDTWYKGELPEGLKDIVDVKWDENTNPFFELKEWDPEQEIGIGGLDPKRFGWDQQEVLEEVINSLPEDSPYRDILQRKMELAAEKKQISSAQYLINQQKNLGTTNPWLNMPGVQVASTGDLTGMGIPNALQQQQQQAAAKAAAITGGAAGASTPTPTVTPKIKTTAPGQSGGYQYQDTAQDRQEQREAERASSQSGQPAGVSPYERGDYGGRGFHWQKGGLVGMNYLTRRL